MFDIGFSELVLIALLALLVLGPKRLPEAARAAGRAIGRLRRFVTDVRQDFDRELQTAELEELRKLKQELGDTRRVIEESSAQLYRKVTADPAPAVPPVSTAAPPAPLVTPPRPRKPRAARPKKNGRPPRTGGS
jgi:sec-independent protein translocase protein TatB